MTDASDSGSTSVDRWRPRFEWSRFWKQTESVREWLLRLWEQTTRALQETAPVTAAAAPASALTGPLSERLDIPVPIRVSGRGRTFNFHIYARCVWSSENLRREELLSAAYQYTPEVIRRLTRLAAAQAVNFAPHRAAELEVELQRVLSEKAPWCYVRGGGVVTCQPHVWVELDERVRKLALPYWEKLVRLDYEHDVAEYADWLNRQRESGPDNPRNGASTGARRNGDDAVDDVRQVVADLRAAAQRLEDLLRRTRPDADRP
ncbi:hypothetical protein DLE60_01970 [Micromonospora globispora]|uniref:hypothetical protein n=1 Tax=Micromonospora globispora TaxID=1450148 RepID=UPI000D6FB84A|nr:hypothetical protein [Micromonospora globispora]PWU62130.1 hypothetical protein DLE60_01970 [Micromonospora globispora]